MYKNPTPVSVAIVPILGEHLTFLAIRRAIAPKIGELAFPSGYVDEHESAEMAASRELSEETQIILPVEHWRAIGTRVTPDNKLLIFNVSPPVSADVIAAFTPTSETSELTVVRPGDAMAFPLHQEVLNLLKASYAE